MDSYLWRPGWTQRDAVFLAHDKNPEDFDRIILRAQAGETRQILTGTRRGEPVRIDVSAEPHAEWEVVDLAGLERRLFDGVA